MARGMELYKALALQTECAAVNRCADKAEARTVMQGSLLRITGQLMSARAFHGPSLKLACLPEYFLTSFPAGESAAEWREKAAVEMNGATYEAIGRMAEKTGMYICANLYESDPHFPALYFQASTITAPSGDLVLRYRRLISMYAPSPYDVMEPYLEHYSLDEWFPVVDTPLGRLAALASEEIRYPEIARILCLKGAEVILHPTSEASSTQMTYKNVAKLARAQENQCYVVSANSAAITGTALTPASTDGRSQVVDDRGLVLAETGWGESLTACADVDIRSLRDRRARVGMDTMLARQPVALHARVLAELAGHPAGTLGAGDEAPVRDFYTRRQADVIERLQKLGII